MKKTLILTGILTMATVISCNNGETGIKDNKSTMSEQSDQSVPGDLKPEYLTTEEFRQKVWDYEASPKEWKYEGELPCVVDFYADWCKPCKMVAPIMDDLADYYKGRVKIYKVNTDNERELATVFQINGIPSILFAPQTGKPAMQSGAMTKDRYIQIIDDFVLKLNKSDNAKKES